MAPEHIDLTTLTDESEDSGHVIQTPLKQRQMQPLPQPSSRTRRPISPPALSRHATASVQGDSAPVPVATSGPGPGPGSVLTTVPTTAPSPSRGNRSSAQKPPRDEVTSAAMPPLKSTGSAAKASQSVRSPPLSTQQHPTHKTPKSHTPKKTDWTSEKIEQALRRFSVEIGTDNAILSTRLIYRSWKKFEPEPKLVSKNWFTGMKQTPAEGGKGTVKIKTKHMGPGRTGKQEKREHYHVPGIKTNRDPVPNYSFHHVEISKNILSPNTMLSFVPHLRDLADEEEPKYRRWLENLESMDKTSGFATLSRQEKVHKTCQKEKATTLLLYLDTWLNALSIESCSKSTLIHYTLNRTDAVTPQQKSSILNTHSENVTSPRSAKAVKLFTEAFDRVFNDKEIWKEGAVTLRDVLFLDKTVDTVVDSKKWMKDTPSQVKHVEENTTVESFLETYALLGCLICCSHSCEHGEYGVDNERKRFSIEVVGGLEPMLRKKAIQAARTKSRESSLVFNPDIACGEDCFHIKRRQNVRAKPWSETELMLLRTISATLSHTKISVPCATAVATGRPCWDAYRQLCKLDLDKDPSVSPPPAAPVKVKPVHWYDRNKKMLLGDWQEHTITHEHQRKDHFDPCSHEGPCNSSCPCVQAHVLCERFCRCTAATCATKFTGCACHSQGKTCVSKQKDRPCICIQLNRECDPALCGSCGAFDRANPQNADDDQLFTHGCQNCPLQRGKSKSLILGKSIIKDCGYGLFTSEDIAQDEFVIEYVGELISQDEGVRREARRGDVFDEQSNSSYLFTLLEQEGIWVDAAIYGNLSRYINHQDDTDKRGLGCNITPKILYVGGEYRIKFSSMRDIKAGEELFFNYGENFPNLTKKLLDEQKEGEKEKKKRRSRKEKGNNGKEDPEGPKKPRAYKGKKRGRKPKKKAFAKIESDPEDEEDDFVEEVPEEDPFPDIIPSPRKRKRANSDSDSEEEEYRPEVVDSDIQSVALEPPSSRSRLRGRKRLATNNTMRKTGRGSLFDRTLHSESNINLEADADSDYAAQNGTPRRRGRKGRKVVDDPDDEEGGDDDDEDMATGMGSTHRSTGSILRSRSRRGMADAEFPAEQDTPSRRTRRQAKPAMESSPLSAPDSAFDHMDVDLSDFGVLRSVQATPRRAGEKRKRGRPRKVPREEVVEQASEFGDEYEGGKTPGSRRRRTSGTLAADSDASSNNARNRSRHRRLPARYSD